MSKQEKRILSPTRTAKKGLYVTAYNYLMSLKVGEGRDIENERQRAIIIEVIECEIFMKGYTTLELGGGRVRKVDMSFLKEFRQKERDFNAL